MSLFIMTLIWGRSPHGERGLKSIRLVDPCTVRRRSPHGERGLKSSHLIISIGLTPVAPRMGSVD